VPEANPQLSRFLSNVPGVVWPPVSSGVAGAVNSMLRSLEDTQWYPPSELQRAQHAQLRLLAEHAAKASPSFGDRLRRAGLTGSDLGTPEGLAQLPPLTRRELQEAGDALFCTELPKGHAPVELTRTSGSTGEPVAVRRTSISGVMWSAMTLRDHLWRGLDFGWRISVCRPTINAYVERRDWGSPISLLYRSGPAQLIPTDTPVDEMADRIATFSPHVLVVYPSVLSALIDRFRAGRRRLPDLRLVHSIAETLSPELRERATAALGARVWDTYSSQELGNIATQCPGSDLLHAMAESVLVEVLDDDGRPCAEGQSGRMVGTDLHNFATPLVRYDLGDYAEVGGECPCGRGLPTLRRVLGRERNLVRLPDGSRHWPLVGFHRFADIAPIRQYQFIQHDLERIEVRMVAAEPVSTEQEAALSTVIREALGHPFDLEFNWFDDRLPVGAGGKFEEFRSEIR
jgi:phenylacetate-CoA ligase